jgi:hypothetical protein
MMKKFFRENFLLRLKIWPITSTLLLLAAVNENKRIREELRFLEFEIIRLRRR